MDGVAADHHATVAQVALNWLLAHEHVSTLLTGVRDAKEADENCAAAEWELTAEEKALLDEAVAKVHIY